MKCLININQFLNLCMHVLIQHNRANDHTNMLRNITKIACYNSKEKNYPSFYTALFPKVYPRYLGDVILTV